MKFLKKLLRLFRQRVRRSRAENNLHLYQDRMENEIRTFSRDYVFHNRLNPVGRIS